MSWLRNSPLRASFSRQPARPLETAAKCDPGACYESFCKHWQQAEEIIQKSRGSSVPSHDDVLGVVSHLEHLVTLLLLEIRHHSSSSSLPEGPGGVPLGVRASQDLGRGGVCLEHLLSENLLDKLYEWGNRTGRYLNAVRLEQMKLYSLLVTHAGQQLLCAEPFLRPLLKLLSSFRTELPTGDVEGRLVCLLEQLCVVLMQNSNFVDLFFYPTSHNQDKQNSSFVPVALLLAFVHREGPVGQQARAALLLCAAISARNQSVAEFIAHRSNVCPVLATGLSGLYCSLPRFVDVTQPDWHRLTPDDVNDIDKLGIFMNSLEFCNAVAQVAHPLIQQQLLDFLYQGFLLPVMGPALLQTKRALATTRPQYLQTGVDEQIAAIAYFELVLRSVSEPGLLKSLVRFLLDNSYDGANILDALVPLIDGEARLSIVTLSLFETLVDLNCEDLMLEMVLKYLIGGHHLMVSHRRRSLDSDLHCKATNMLLNLAPDCCITKPLTNVTSSRRNSTAGSRKPSISSMDQNLHSLSSIGEQGAFYPTQKNVISYGLHTNESLYGNYHAYLCEARRKIQLCKSGCKQWSSKYDGHANGLSKIPNDKIILSVVKDFQLEHSNLIKDSSNPFTVENYNDEGLSEPMSNNNLHTSPHVVYTSSKEEDSLQSIGESSGYDSFKYKSEDHHGTPDEEHGTSEDDKEFTEDSFWRQAESIDRLSSLTHETVKKRAEKDASTRIGDVNIGPLLKITLNKLGQMLDNDVYVNLRLTGLITRLAVYPLPLLRSFLLCPWIVLQPSITSLYQILVSLKQKIDESVRNESEMYRLLEEAQNFLIDREIRLSNARKNAIELIGSKNQQTNADRNSSTPTRFNQHTTQHQNSDVIASQPNSGNWEQAPPSPQPQSISEPFKRNEPKRKSISSSFTAMFSRKMITGGISLSPTNNVLQIENSHPRGSIPLPYSSYSEDNLWQSSQMRRIIVNAVILDEWLRELGSLAQEHVVSSITDLMNSTNMENGESANAQNKVL